MNWDRRIEQDIQKKTIFKEKQHNCPILPTKMHMIYVLVIKKTFILTLGNLEIF